MHKTFLLFLFLLSSAFVYSQNAEVNSPKKKKSASRKTDKTRNPKKAPWNGVNYEGHRIFPPESERELQIALEDPEMCIETAMDVVGDNNLRSYGNWLKMLNKAVQDGKPLKSVLETFKYCILKTFREQKQGELACATKYFNHILKKELHAK